MADNNSGSMPLLSPTTSNVFITMDWGYCGEISSYPISFASIGIVTLNNFGETYSNAAQRSEYMAVIQPRIDYTSALRPYVATLVEYTIRYRFINSSITSRIAKTVKQSYSLVKNLVNASFAKIVFVDGNLTIASINYNEIKFNKYILDPEAADTNSSHVEMYSYDQTVSRFRISIVTDAGNTVTLSAPGYKGTVPPVWSEDGSFLARSFYGNITFLSQGPCNIRVQLSYSTALHANYTVNRKMAAIIVAQNVVSAAIIAYFTGGIFGGTTFSGTGYNWEWYINGVYNKSIGDASYDIPIVFNNTGTYNITLVVHDALLGKTSVSILLHVLNPTSYKIYEGIRDNITAGSLFYFSVVIIAVLESVIYVKANRKRK